MGVFLVPADLASFATIDEAKATEMIADAEAMAALAAPCITEADFQADTTLMGAMKALLRGAVLRWHDAGSGAIQSQQVGPFGQTFDTRQARRSMFWPSEIEQLRGLCTRFKGASTGAFALNLAPTGLGVHRPWCALYFGANYCSCGADIAGFPIYEGA